LSGEVLVLTGRIRVQAVFVPFCNISCEANGKLIQLDAIDNFRMLSKIFHKKKKKFLNYVTVIQED